MSEIPWTEKTLNVTAGCTKVSPGCANCYAEKMANRVRSIMYVQSSDKSMETWAKYDEVLTMSGKWNGHIFCDEAALDKITPRQKPKMIFVNSMSDLFHPGVPFEFIDKVALKMSLCEQHTYQILTKRPERALMCSRRWMNEDDTNNLFRHNVWLGISAENQKWLDIRAQLIMQIQAAVIFLSIEPMLGPIDLERYMDKTQSDNFKCNVCGAIANGAYMTHIDYFGEGIANCPDCNTDLTDAPEILVGNINQVIIGCESNGPHLGRMGEFEGWHEWLDAAIDIVEQCKAAGVPVFVKQIPKLKDNGWRLEKNPKNFPASLQYQEYPK